MMTLEQAIDFYNLIADSKFEQADRFNKAENNESEYCINRANACRQDAIKYTQLVSWLMELKQYRERLQ